MIFIKAVYETLMPQTELLNKHITVFLSLETINYRHQWKEGIIRADGTIFKEKLAKSIPNEVIVCGYVARHGSIAV